MYMVTTFLKNPEMSGNFTHVGEMLAISVKLGKCQGIVVGEKLDIENAV